MERKGTDWGEGEIGKYIGHLGYDDTRSGHRQLKIWSFSFPLLPSLFGMEAALMQATDTPCIYYPLGLVINDTFQTPPAPSHHVRLGWHPNRREDLHQIQHNPAFLDYSRPLAWNAIPHQQHAPPPCQKINQEVVTRPYHPSIHPSRL